METSSAFATVSRFTPEKILRCAAGLRKILAIAAARFTLDMVAGQPQCAQKKIMNLIFGEIIAFSDPFYLAACASQHICQTRDSCRRASAGQAYS
jgi:hypothetical protein